MLLCFRIPPRTARSSVFQQETELYSKRTLFPFVSPIPAIQVPLFCNKFEKQHDAPHIIQSMIAAVVAGCLY